MKNFIWLFSFAVLFAFCKNETTDNKATDAATNTATDPHAGHDHATSDSPQHIKASPDSPYVGLWVVQQAMGKKINDDAKGKWFNLKADNTFESGQWQESRNTGTWSYLPNSNYIRLVFAKAEDFPGEWEVQGSGDRILWKGNTPANPEGTQMLMTQETVLPQKQ